MDGQIGLGMSMLHTPLWPERVGGGGVVWLFATSLCPAVSGTDDERSSSVLRPFLLPLSTVGFCCRDRDLCRVRPCSLNRRPRVVAAVIIEREGRCTRVGIKHNLSSTRVLFRYYLLTTYPDSRFSL